MRGAIAAAGMGIAGFGAAVALAAPAHSNPCHSNHVCPSDHATYVWLDPNGQGWLCVEPGAKEYDSSYSTVTVYAGLSYDCKAAGSSPPPTTAAPATTGPGATTRVVSVPTASRVKAGTTVRLATQTRRSGCKLGALPDRRCSPGAYDTGLTTAVLCSSTFHTSTVRNVSESEKHTLEAAYGLAPAAYGSTVEIDHIISLELGGSNDASNLYPELAPGYHLKDKLENKLHRLVCSGAMALRTAQTRIGQDWETLYRDVFGALPRVR